MQEAWYVLEDGRTVDPNEVARTKPMSCAIQRRGRGDARPGAADRGVDPVAERARSETADSKSPKSDKKDVKPEEQKSGYKTREAKGN